MVEQVRALQGDTVDLLCWRHYGYTAGVTEQVLDTNPGLADLGALLPAGTLVTLPDAAVEPAAVEINLWD